MNLIFKNFHEFFSKKGLIIPLGISILLLLTILSQSIYSILAYDNIYSGVYINGIHVGTLSTDEARNLMKQRIENNYPDSIIELKCNGISEKFTIRDAQVNYMLERAIDNAYLVGRKGSLISRIASIINAKRYGKIISFSFTYNEKFINSIIDKMYNKVFQPVKECDFTISGENAIITSGISGYNFDKSELINNIERHIAAGTSGIINIPLINTKPSIISVDEFYNKIYTPPQNAHYKIENGELIIVPHVIGIDIDKILAAQILESVQKQEGSSRTLPLITTMPDVLESDLQSVLFRDELYTASTTFNANNINRAHNIKLASDKINGTVLLPGEIFSYNDVVGPRTTELGYKAAGAYINGRIVDSTGGGICQVSSTLYNTVLFSDLEVVERTNHHFTVAYVLLGHDATVTYDQVDFKFRNSTAWPIKIISKVTGGKITITLQGTKEEKDKIIQTRINVKQTLPFSENVSYDDSLPEGTRIVTTSGTNGYVVDLYKIIKKGEKVIDEKLVSTDRYYPLKQEVVIGTKKAPVVSEGMDNVENIASDSLVNGISEELNNENN